MLTVTFYAMLLPEISPSKVIGKVLPLMKERLGTILMPRVPGDEPITLTQLLVRPQITLVCSV